jgi:hypothetical protein
VLDEIPALEQKTYAAGTEGGAASLAAAGKALAAHPDGPAIGFVEAAEAGYEGRLAGAGGSRDSDELSLFDLE